nr:putative ribonuclease H-like domain-containing protein [Tanacetum cinerariifolium]
STSRGCQFLESRLISWQCKKKTMVATSTIEAKYVAAASYCGQFWCTASARALDNEEIELNATVDGQAKTITEASVRRHLKLAHADAEQNIGNISKTQTKATPFGPSSPRTSSEGYLGCHFTIRDSHVQVRPESLSNLPNEPPLEEEKVTSLENELTSTKAVYNKALITLTKRVKKLEKQLKHKERRAFIDSSDDAKPSLDVEDSPKQGRMIVEIDKDENVNLVKSSEQGEAHKTAEHTMESEFSTASPQKDDDDTTLVETLLNI